ncbi:cobyrinate a,c-diamide synthase [Actinoplanes teichomyceticus]|uniref:Hydrogenobyrinate a,c-diamide synthase n=1 Tax=Actinoplanes teichomyceticus TaxID=1867 RepID=A0A561W9T5_ACTTI|nr:cobyrinate a,c-diamide synthase [Actinoplanes teichomyceticus]TWG20609.1 cobyrinic acid a,c-diamide synthase [Actinoplanes teichomyceticus]GIF15944.1 hydrogenobyrinate a,c-diamide synthase [Actinoplanes teichomyceticus]
MVSIPRVVIAAPASGHGKTTVATGLLAAFARRGVPVAPFKVGPDYIDPGYHALAAGRPGRNLDPVMVGEDLIGPLFAHGARGAELAVVEGVMGLYDGRTGAGETGSTAQVAGLLQAPVILVVDAAAQGRSVAALVHGFRSFGTVRLAGVILNRVGSQRHEQILRDACEEVGTPVLGALRRADAVAAPSRHLGLVPAAERRAEALASVDALATLIAEAVDLDAVAAVARSAPPLPATPWTPAAPDPVPGRPMVALAGGPAFSFAYAETAELLAGAGAEVVIVDPLRDPALPEGTRALVVGGGFPEVYAAELSANEPLRRSVRDLAATGRPIAAECAGLLWLCRTLDGAPMCGVLDADAAMTPSLTLGYRDAVALADSPLAAAGTRVTGHEFHRTAVHPRSGLLLSPASGAAWAWRGADPEGFASPGVHASYLHLHWAGHRGLAERLVRTAAAQPSPGPAAGPAAR